MLHSDCWNALQEYFWYKFLNGFQLSFKKNKAMGQGNRSFLDEDLKKKKKKPILLISLDSPSSDIKRHFLKKYSSRTNVHALS